MTFSFSFSGGFELEIGRGVGTEACFCGICACSLDNGGAELVGTICICCCCDGAFGAEVGVNSCCCWLPSV